MAVIGIDLGTTNSLGCVYRNGKAELIPNAYGSYLTPSVVSMTEDGKLIVGQPAKDRLITHPERTVSSFKKDMGTGRSWKPGEKSFLPEELSSLVIRSIVEDAQNYLGEEIEEAVISVPAYLLMSTLSPTLSSMTISFPSTTPPGPTARTSAT